MIAGRVEAALKRGMHLAAAQVRSQTAIMGKRKEEEEELKQRQEEGEGHN